MIRTGVLLLLVLGLQVFWQSLTRHFWGNIFLALGFALAVEGTRRYRWFLLFVLGMVEGYFRGAGSLAGLVSAFVVGIWQELLIKNLDLSSLGALAVYACSSLVLFNWMLLVLFPYLWERNFFPSWGVPFLLYNFLTGAEMMFFLLWKRRRKAEEGYWGRVSGDGF
ncbi:hypothetical protein [Thermosulfurimonas sp.]|uniref:hypothetical protein n=1 Tax=Thermosulfurimonas sp. TaxID=2080236 RepID=UPI0025D1C4E1|nr:hypothetical protein [Thermosulfurimonas sp.]